MATASGCLPGDFFAPNLEMGYYDGNTVTALWNYAQRYAMSDNFFDTEFGTTVMGHLNLISGQTHGTASADIAGKIVNGSVIANVNPQIDDCPGAPPNITMTGKNVGDLLTAANVTWGWFYGDFAALSISGGKAVCQPQYNSHYDPFQYYASTANKHHLPPTSVAMIGKNGDQANHQYDLSSFFAALANGNLPAVSFLKASVTQTGHPSDSTPLAEQQFLVNTINQLMSSPFWKDVAILIAYDDSDGWYDHVMPPIINPSNDPKNDALEGNPKGNPPNGSCGPARLAGAYNDRCGFGQRLPFLVISPFAKRNYVDHSLNDTTSAVRFIEDNWGLGRIGDPQSFDVLAGGSILGMFDFDENPRAYRGRHEIPVLREGWPQRDMCRNNDRTNCFRQRSPRDVLSASPSSFWSLDHCRQRASTVGKSNSKRATPRVVQRQQCGASDPSYHQEKRPHV
jgi:phospholipase C